jgi:hypothetical protein
MRYQAEITKQYASMLDYCIYLITSNDFPKYYQLEKNRISNVFIKHYQFAKTAIICVIRFK